MRYYKDEHGCQSYYTPRAGWVAIFYGRGRPVGLYWVDQTADAPLGHVMDDYGNLIPVEK